MPKTKPKKSQPSPARTSTSNWTQRSIKLTFKHLSFLGLAFLALILVGGYLFTQWFVVATVNGQPITRLTLHQELVQQGGQETLDNLITQTLIEQAAVEQGITVSKDTIDSEIAELEASMGTQDRTLDQVLELQGMTRQALVEQIRVNNLITQMLDQNIQLTDDQVQSYLEENQDLYQDIESEAERLEAARQDLRSQTQRETFYTWIEDLRNQANISTNL